MKRNRLEAFSDGVVAILITIMVLEFRVPTGNTYSDLIPLFPKFVSYSLSFLYIAIYWNNHHHLLHTVKEVTGKMLWANMFFLFWLSLIPFATAWVGEHHFDNFPMTVYGFVLLMNGFSYLILQKLIIKSQGETSVLHKAIGKDYKGKLSFFLYLIAIFFTFYSKYLPGILYIVVALMWLVPDKRIERIFKKE
jgi:uncharacterized membrane protein